MTTRTAKRIGDPVTWSEGEHQFRGEVVGFRGIDERQILTVKRDDGRTVVIALDKMERPDLNSPVSREEAVELARAIVAGKEPRLAVATQINMLALALLEEVEPRW